MKTNCPECLRKENCNPDIHNGKCMSMRTDNIKKSQHALYRGFILPAIVDAMGETNPNYVHEFILKTEWLSRTTGYPYLYYEHYNDIPVKYQEGNARIERSIGFLVVPSMKTFTQKETKEYLQFCLNLLHVELNGAILEEKQHEYKQARLDARL